MKVVLDTNVLLAAFATRGLCDKVLASCLDAHEVVLSEPIIAELSGCLTTKLKLPPDHARDIVHFLRGRCVLVQPDEVPGDACPDPSDLAVLGTASACDADCLVTGDHALLGLGSFRGIPILTPRALDDRLS